MTLLKLCSLVARPVHLSADKGLASSPGRFSIIEREGEGKKRPGIHCTGGKCALLVYFTVYCTVN